MKRVQFRIDPSKVQVTIDGDQVVRDAITVMEDENPNLYEQQPGFIRTASLARHMSVALTAAVAILANAVSGIWGRVQKGIAYLKNEVAQPLSACGQATGDVLNGLIALTTDSKALPAAFVEAWGSKDRTAQRLFTDEGIAAFFNAAARLTYAIPNPAGQTEMKSGAQILREYAEAIGANENKAFVALCLAAERYAQTGDEDDRLTGEDCVKAFAALRPDGTQITAAPTRVRTAVAERHGNGHTAFADAPASA